jgi:Kdo2-lipid IVA lauroyltransferase/acyltransferase
MLSLLRWLARKPLWFLHVLGSALGWATYWASPSYRNRFNENLRQAGVSSAEAKQAVAAAGRMVAELPYLWLRPANQLITPQLKWQGLTLIEQALKNKRGVVMLTPHMGCFEVTAQAIAQVFAAQFGPITVLYRPARKPLLRKLMDESRARPGVSTAPATLSGVRQMMRALRRGEVVGLLPDQVPPEGMGVWAPFFGKPAYTMTLAARLIQQTGAIPLLIWGERLAKGTGYTVHVSELGETLPSHEGESTEEIQTKSAAIINRAMERLIRQCPQQYLWGYHRYKTPRSALSADIKNPKD